MDLVEAIGGGYNIRAIVQALAGKKKVKKPPARKRLTITKKEKQDDEIPYLEDYLGNLGVKIETVEDPQGGKA